MHRLALVVMLGCAHAPAPASAPAPAPAAVTLPPSAEPRPALVSPWSAVPVRVMTWTPRGVVQIGELPGALPSPLPALWYVEPIHELDEAGFRRLVALVRGERVPGLSVKGQEVAAWLDQLADLPVLTALVLDGSDVDDAALARVALALTRLYAPRTAITDAGIAAAADRYPALEVLDLEDTGVGDAAARAIARLEGLRALNLSATQITDEAGAALGALTRLEVADLGHTRVAARTIAALRQLPLRELFLENTRVRGEVAGLAGLAPRLVRFDISDTRHHPSDAELAWLAGAHQLVELGVSGARLHDPLALVLAGLPRLRTVRMADTEITLATIRAIAARRDLEEIDLAGTPVDDASAAALLASPDIQIVRLDDTPISDAALAGPAGGELTQLYVSRTAIGDPGLAILDATPRLAALGVGNTRIGDASLDRIARLSELHTLVLSAARVSQDALAKLAALTGLERLYLDRSQAGDATLAALAATRETLQVLHLAGSDVSDAGLTALRAFTELTELTLGDSQVGSGISDLAAWRHLRTLSLVGLALDDTSLPRLAERHSLVVLDLSATDIRDPLPLAGLPHLRTLGLAQTRLSPAGVAAAKRLAARGIEVVR